jgi:hypothetical protein
LTKKKIVLSKYLFRRWIILCRTYTISGRVVKRVWKWDQIEQMYVPCDEPVPGAKVEAYDVDCWWFWWKKDLVGSTVTNPDGTFEIKFKWCCLLWRPILKPAWVIDPDLLKHITEAAIQHVGPIPPEALASPIDFERFLGCTKEFIASASQISREALRPLVVAKTSSCGEKVTPVIPLSRPKGIEFVKQQFIADASPIKDLITEIRPLFPHLKCWPFWPKDCSPDIVFTVTQECEGDVNIIYNEGPCQNRWNIPTNLDVTLLANEKACSIPVCEEPPAGDCLKFSWVNCVGVENIGVSAGPPDLRGYTNPESGDNPFCETIHIKGLFGAGSDDDYLKVQYSYNGGIFKDMAICQWDS